MSNEGRRIYRRARLLSAVLAGVPLAFVAGLIAAIVRLVGWL